MDEKFQAEVDANFKAFQGMLPELLARETNRWALMRHGECVGFFDTLRDAHIAGHTMYEDDLFSVQQVTAEVVDLGWFSHAVYWRHLRRQGRNSAAGEALAGRYC